MSLSLNFEPHSWYMGFAIKKAVEPSNHTRILWEGFTENGNFYFVDSVEAAYTLKLLKARIRAYHLNNHTGYGERLAKRRLAYLRGEIEAERISVGEIAELQALQSYIDPSDVLLLEWAGVKEKL